MADRSLYTQEAALAKATTIVAQLALSKLRLFKSALVPNEFTTKADLLAAECDFDGYPPAGYPLTAWTGPLVAAGGGAVVTSPLVNVAYGPAGVPPAGNDVGGGWVETAAGAVRLVLVFDPPRPLNGVGQGFPVIEQVVEGRNP